MALYDLITSDMVSLSLRPTTSAKDAHKLLRDIIQREGGQIVLRDHINGFEQKIDFLEQYLDD